MEKNRIVKWVLGKVIFQEGETVPYFRAVDLNRIRLFRYEEENDTFFTIDEEEYGTEAIKILAELPEKTCQHLSGFYSQKYRRLLEKSERFLVEWYDKSINLPKEMENE